MPEKLEAKFGLLEEVIYCKRCVMSNQKPSSSIEFQHARDRNHKTLHIDEEGVCDACRFAEIKEQIDWEQRGKELLQVLGKHRFGSLVEAQAIVEACRQDYNAVRPHSSLGKRTPEEAGRELATMTA